MDKIYNQIIAKWILGRFLACSKKFETFIVCQFYMYDGPKPFLLYHVLFMEVYQLILYN